MIHYNKSHTISSVKLLISTFLSVTLISFAILSPEKYLSCYGKLNYYSIFIGRFISQIIPSYIQNSKNNVKIISELRDYNQQLTKQIQELNAQYLHIAQIKKENQELRHLLNVKKNPNIKSIITVLIQKENIISTKTLGSKIILPVGSNDNIDQKSLIVAPLGAIGYITKIYNNKSVAKTLLDKQFKISAFTETSKYNIIVSGNGTQTPDVQIYSETYTLIENEMISTSGLEGIFPRNIPIGTLFKDPNTKTWKVKLLVDFSTISYIFIVK